VDYKFNFIAPKTCAEFMLDRYPRKILAGPVGGGKTSACIAHILKNATEQAPDRDGIRRSKHLVVRNTVPMLKSTTIKTFLDWIPDGTLGQYYISDKIYNLKFGDVDAEVSFMSLEDSNDIRKLLSLETTTVFLNEFREINPDIVEALIGTKRIGRYPSKKGGPGATYPCMIADTNMPSYDSWHQQVMDGQLMDFKLFKQPSGRSPEAENLANLPDDYYNIDGLSEEYIRTMVDVEYGSSKEGMPVFKSSFIKDYHVAKGPLSAISSSSYPLIVGMDAGLTPAAIIGQQLPTGRLNILAEVFTPRGETMGMERFLETKLMPVLMGRFGDNPALGIIDPAGEQRSQADEQTVFEIIKKKMRVRLAPTNKLDLRIGSAETFFARQVMGEAGLLIDPSCTNLIAALEHNYRYAVKRSGEIEEKPEKSHPVSDIVDGFMYLTVHLAGTNTRDSNRLAVPVVPVSFRGWA
jgi:hypothetical protein